MTSYAQIAANNAAIEARNKARKPGPKTPGKYPVQVGPNYNVYGEQPGYLYNPYTDKYMPDPKAVAEISGQPKAPGLMGQIAIPAAVIGGAAVAQEVGKQIPGLVKDGKNALLGIGKDGQQPTTTSPTTISNNGLLGVGGGSPTINPSSPVAGATQASQDAYNSAAMGSQPTATVPAGSTTGPNGEILQPDGSVVDPQSGASIGTWAQGVGGAVQIYAGYNQWQNGNKFGGGLGMAAGAANIGAAAGSQMAANVAGPLGAAYGAYTLGNMAYNGGNMHSSDTGNLTAQGAVAGASIGSVVPGVGTAIGAGVGALIGAGIGLSASHKGQRQNVRDQYRKTILDNNVPLFDQNYKGTLADGSTYDFGKDKFSFGEKEGDINLSDPTTAKAAAYGNVLAAVQGTSGKAREAIATQFLAAANSNASGDLNRVKENYGHFFSQLGLDQAKAQGALDAMLKDGKMTEQEHAVFSSDLAEMSNQSPPTGKIISTPTSPAVAGPATVPIKNQNRSSTRSPGIDLNGNRIVYR